MYTTLVCVLFVATTTSTISVYYFSMCTVFGHSYELGVHMYCLWPLLFMCLTIVLVCIVYYSQFTTHKWSHLGVARHLGVTEKGHIQIFQLL